MNDGLIDALRHNAWAMRSLLSVCKGLTQSQWQATATGTYGSIAATMWHTISAEASYCARLMGEEPGWDRRAKEPPGVADMESSIVDLAERWDRFLAHPFDAERTIVVKWRDGIDRDVPAGVFLAQALHHGNEHRAHICTILTSIGVPTPELGVWNYAEATNRATPKREAH